MKVLPVFTEIEPGASEPFPQVSLRDRLGALDSSLRQPLSDYLVGCTPLVATGNVPDPLDDTKGYVVPFGLSTDGSWVWPTYWGYFVLEYGVEVPDDFLAHVRLADFVPVDLPPGDIERVTEELERGI
ncbi:hypothetical protein ACTWP5_28680 [Streptomyces sp. 4N509B]|uniref:hypothetical protein n=1 Tax=Streptomyces sp. 4N509B TaxID=3457413 RepID=UPI003FCFFD68